MSVRPGAGVFAAALEGHGTGEDMGGLAVDVDAVEGTSVVVLRCHGDIDAHTIGELEGAVAGALEAGVSHMVVDVADVGYFSSRGLGILIAARKTVLDRGGALVLLNPNEPVKTALDALGLENLFAVAATEQEALDIVRS